MNMAMVRRWHAYIGLFIAPSVLFFALTGAVQVFSLHEAHGAYRPPAIVERLSSVHKDQVFRLGHHHDPAKPEASSRKFEAVGTSGTPEQADDKTTPTTLALKAFFLLVALCLAISTVIGLWMGVTQIRHKRTAWVLLFAGVLIPIALLLCS